VNRDKLIDKLFTELFEVQKLTAERVQDFEKRIAILESKPSETDRNRTVIDSEDAGATEVPTGENESDIERCFEDYQIGEYLDFRIPYSSKTTGSIILRNGEGINRCGYFGKWYIVAPIKGTRYKVWGHEYAEEY